jgi:hypothetical protein
MSTRITVLFAFLSCAGWAMAQARPASPPPPPSHTSTPTAAPPSGTPAAPNTTAMPSSTIGPPTPITTKAAGETESTPQTQNTPPQNTPGTGYRSDDFRQFATAVSSRNGAERKRSTTVNVNDPSQCAGLKGPAFILALTNANAPAQPTLFQAKNTWRESAQR